MSILSRKIDDAFVEALDSSEDLAEAIAKWAGVSQEVADEVAAGITTEMLELLKDKNSQEAEVAVLRAIKPDATLKDYLMLRSLVSSAIAHGMNECLENVGQNGVGRISTLLTPEPGKPSIVLAFPSSVIAIKADNDVISNIMQLAGGVIGARTPTEAMLNIAGALATLGEPGAVHHPGDDILEAINQPDKDEKSNDGAEVNDDEHSGD